MGPIAKLFACYLNLSLEMQASLHGWLTPIQAGSCRNYRLEDLLVLVDYILTRAQTRKLLLVLYLSTWRRPSIQFRGTGYCTYLILNMG